MPVNLMQWLWNHPLGSGDTLFAFGQYANMEYSGLQVIKTHGGWLDFALETGFLGSFLM